MAYETNLTGIISKNDRKTTEQHPDIKGQCEINGTEFWISGWRKERKDGSGFFYSLKFNAKDAQPVSSSRREEKKELARAEYGDDDSIPFANPYRGKWAYAV